jgi:hypothetical protein
MRAMGVEDSKTPTEEFKTLESTAYRAFLEILFMVMAAFILVILAVILF